MEKDRNMPSALEIARALSRVLDTKLADFGAERIELDRKEAALCLGLVNGVVERLELEDAAGA